MSRPRTVSDERILSATAQAVAKVGPHRLTLEHVAAAVGLTPPALVKRFGSRRGLLLAFVEHAADEAGRRFEDARARARSPLDALLDALATDPQGSHTVETVANGLAFLQIDIMDKEFRARTRDFFMQQRAAIVLLLDEAVEKGELARCDTGKLARAVEVAANGSILLWAIHGDGDAEDAVRHDVEAVLAPFRRPR